MVKFVFWKNSPKNNVKHGGEPKSERSVRKEDKATFEIRDNGDPHQGTGNRNRETKRKNRRRRSL